MLGFIGCIPDSSTLDKMQENGCGDAFIPQTGRLRLIDSAAEDENFDWSQAPDTYYDAIEQLKTDFPQHKFYR